MKALLINPALLNLIHVPGPSDVWELATAAPPLGLLYVAAFAEKNTSHQIEVLDADLDKLSPDGVSEKVRQSKPDVVGITTTTFSMVDVVLTAKAVKRVSPEIPVVLGGPHVYLYPSETMKIPEVDYLIVGDGERAFSQFLDALDGKGDLSNVPGLVWRSGGTRSVASDGEIIANPPAPFVEDLDSLPLPARHLVPIRRYCSQLTSEALVAAIMSSRGCPYHCSFCCHQHSGPKFRPRSARSVVEEIALCVEMGFREIVFYDDTFTVSRKRVLEICDLLIERRIPVKWDVRTRADRLDEPLIERMAQAGCTKVRIGVEAGTPEILRVLRKEINLDQCRRVFRKAAECGMTTFAYFMIGSPTETREQIEQTVAFAKSLRADFVQFGATLPLPGTEIYEMGLSRGVIANDFWREFASNPRADFQLTLWEEKLRRDEILNLLNWAYKSFYGRPSYLLRRLTKIRSASELYRQARVGLKMLLSQRDSWDQ